MQPLSRALVALRGAWHQTAAASARLFSEAATGARSAAAGLDHDGAKSVLFKILGATEEPLTSAQVWEAAQQEGLKSKRFTKQMLAQLKAAGWVKTQPWTGSKKNKSHAYKLNPQRQAEFQTKLQQQVAKQAAATAAATAALAAPSK